MNASRSAGICERGGSAKGALQDSLACTARGRLGLERTFSAEQILMRIPSLKRAFGAEDSGANFDRAILSTMV
jgi:hypothetical protein